MNLKKLTALLLALAMLILLAAGCGQKLQNTPEGFSSSLELDHSLPLRFASQFSVDYYQGGYAGITIDEVGQFLLVPENAPVPADLSPQITVLQQPLEHIYLVSSAVMDLFRELDALDAIRLSGTKTEDWYIPEARRAMEDDRILYAGKYNAPDYELILAEGCDLAVENTMIFHSPEVKEQLEGLGIPVLVDRSSYESNPLGRMEWLKLYGVLLGREDRADAYFDRLLASLEPVMDQASTGQSVGFFFITNSGMVNVRKPSDYISRCIELAGGTYLFPELEDDGTATATTTIQMESFYAAAKNADVLIYNSSISGELETTDELLALSSLLSGCKAVEEGNVWCTGKNLYQETLGLGNLILDIHAILTADDPDSLELSYLHRLK